MEEIITQVFDWIGEHEGVLSGIVAIVALVGLTITWGRKLMGRSSAAQFKTPATMPAMAQDIRYCETADGKRIAYAVTGTGTPIVRSMGWFTHLEVEWSSALGRSFWQRLSREHALVRYDGRGIGLSEPTTEFSAATRLADLEAVVDATGVERFALMSLSEGSRTALRYQAKHPERVSHLILYGSAIWRHPEEDTESRKAFGALLAMIEAGWGRETHQKFFADLFLGLDAPREEIDYFMDLLTSSASADVANAYVKSLAERENGFELAAQVSAPTLILHPKDDQMVPFQNSLDLAAEIPGARFKPLNGDCHFLMLGTERSQAEEYVTAIEDFLRDG